MISSKSFRRIAPAEATPICYLNEKMKEKEEGVPEGWRRLYCRDKGESRHREASRLNMAGRLNQTKRKYREGSVIEELCTKIWPGPTEHGSKGYTKELGNPNGWIMYWQLGEGYWTPQLSNVLGLRPNSI